MVAVMNNKKSVSRWQGQQEVDADSRRNKQIKTTAVAAAAFGNGGRKHVIAAIDDGGQWTIVRRWQARAAKTTVGIERT